MHANCGGAVVNSFKQAVHLSIATAEDHDVVGIGEVGYMDTSLNALPSSRTARCCPRTSERISKEIGSGRLETWAVFIRRHRRARECGRCLLLWAWQVVADN